MAEPVLRIQSLALGRGGAPLVRGLEIELRPGEALLVTGSNGVGKSSLLDVLTLELAPMAGEVLFGGAPLKGRGADVARRRGIVRAYQRPRIVNELTALENILLGRRARARAFLASIVGRDRVAEAAVPLQVLEGLGYTRIAGRMGSELSMGERRVVEIGRALAADEAVLLLFDEPLANLELDAAKRFAERLRARLAEGASALLIEHRPTEELAIKNHLHLDDYAFERSLTADREPDDGGAGDGQGGEVLHDEDGHTR
ncbi:MAG: ATP-binding cassette domain-containing protein [Polyangiaceae bacterium]|nr:ATP-binding cassette domain-containing protein [Polyangiaceae bacterium]